VPRTRYRDRRPPGTAPEYHPTPAGCAANFAWRDHRRTRCEYRPDTAAAELLMRRGIGWASDIGLAAAEVHALFRIREWGER